MADPPADWQLLASIERLGASQAATAKSPHVRFTLGDALVAFAGHSADATALRTALVHALHAVGGYMEPGAQGEVVYCFPRATRRAAVARSAAHRAASWRRIAWRGLVAATKCVFALWLVLSLVLAFLAVVAAFILAISQRGGGGDSRDVLPITTGFSGGGGGGGGGPGYRGDPFMDLYWYMTMRDITWLMFWTEQERYNAQLARQLAQDPFGEAVKPSMPRGPAGRPGGGGGGGGPGGGGGDPPPPGGPGPSRPWLSLADEPPDFAHDASMPTALRRNDLSFTEAVFAFVFGRGDPNSDLELRRWRAVGMLLRACQGCVFAEQVAPFLDTYLLRGDASAKPWAARLTTALPRGLAAWTRRWGLLDSDGARDEGRMHEGYMLPVLTRFGGFAESSDDGRLVYVFPALRVTATSDGAGPSAARPHAVAVAPPVAPPLYERHWPLWDGGEKQPIVILLGMANGGLLWLFQAIGGLQIAAATDAATADAAAARARAQAKALGRKAGAGFAQGAAQPRAELGPNTVRVLTAITRLATTLFPALAAYAIAFFALPVLRALYAHTQNQRINRRNAARKRAAADALAAALAAVEDGRAAAAARLRQEPVVVAPPTGEP